MQAMMYRIITQTGKKRTNKRQPAQALSAYKKQPQQPDRDPAAAAVFMIHAAETQYADFVISEVRG